MKITFLLTQDLESPSGLGRYYPWAKELHRHGYEVELISLHGDFYNLKERKVYFQEGFLVYYVSQMHVLKMKNHKYYFPLMKLLWVVLLATIRLTFFSLRSKADIYILGKPHPMNGVAGLITKLLYRKQLIVDCDDDEANSGNFKNRGQKRIIQIFETFIPKCGDLVTTNTSYSKQRLIRSGISEDRIYFLSNGVDLDRFNNFDNQTLTHLRHDLGLNEKRVIAYIGSMSLTNHAVNLLIDAFQLITNEGDIKLLLVGGGEDFSQIKEYAKQKGILSNTIFVGKVDPDEIKYYYKLADITVDPVYDDIAAKARSPLKIFESWACGVPVVTSPVGDRLLYAELGSDCIMITRGISPSDYKDTILDFISNFFNTSFQCSNFLENFYWKKIIQYFLTNNSHVFTKKN